MPKKNTNAQRVPKGDVVTQAEIERVLKMNDEVNTAAWRLEKRVADGAAVEAGKRDVYTLGAEAEPPKASENLSIDNLIIDAPEHVKSLKEVRAQAEARFAQKQAAEHVQQEEPKPSLFNLFRRAVARATKDDADYLRDFLCAYLDEYDQIPAVEVALRTSTHHYGIYPPVEDLVYEGKDGRVARLLRGVGMIAIKEGWLLDVFTAVADRVTANDQPSPDFVLDLVSNAANEQDNELDMAREVLAKRPGALAREIVAAAEKLGEKS
jgi:hypothetical protein